MPEVLDMGQYGAFVWPAYALTAAVMAGLLAASLHRLKRCRRALAAMDDPLARRGGRRRAKKDEQT